MANTQTINVGFISRHLFAQPNSPNGWISHETIMIVLHPIVTAPIAICSHMIGNCAKPIPDVFAMIFEKNGNITAKIVAKFTTTATVDKSPCFTKFAFSSLCFAG